MFRSANPKHDQERIEGRLHPLGAPLPVLDWQPSFDVYGRGNSPIQTTRLGVTTWWELHPKSYPDPLLSLYSWSRDDSLAFDGRTFAPGSPCFWRDRRRLAQGGKPWKVTLVAVATEHVGRTLHLLPALMVRLYNGSLAFALPHEVDL